MHTIASALACGWRPVSRCAVTPVVRWASLACRCRQAGRPARLADRGSGASAGQTKGARPLLQRRHLHPAPHEAGAQQVDAGPLLLAGREDV
eukprot:4042720-Prymnesium_polylepis.1